MSLLGTTCFLIYTLMKEYLEFNSFNEISVKWEKSVTLPAITICSTNSINFTEFDEAVTTANAEDDLKNLLLKIEQYNGVGGITDAIDKDLVKKVDNMNNALKNTRNETVSIFDDYMFEPEAYLLGMWNGIKLIFFHPLHLCIFCSKASRLSQSKTAIIANWQDGELSHRYNDKNSITATYFFSFMII